MKLSSYFIAFVLFSLVTAAGSALADMKSLRGTIDVPTTNSAPELEKVIRDKENVERTFKQQPPVIPHESTDDKYAINLRENKCLDCHVKQPGKDKAKSVEMSESHFIDRNGNKHDRPVGARYFCDQCHVPQVDAPPLVGTTFKSVAAK